jgi:Protein of unknown function (DUF2914)/Tetratricopeptide repeat
MIDAAQHAAAAGDYAAAERLLRDAAATQEATLGSSHPDLATTLNNLAFVCERTGRVDEAERGYRRAHAIAVASLSPGHPFIKTSLSNLVEFCEARGIPLWTPPETPTEDEPLLDDVESEPLPDEVEGEPSAIDVAPPVADEPFLASRQPIRVIAAAAFVIAAVVVIMVVAGRKGEAPRAVPQAPTESVAPAEPEVSKTATPVSPAAPESTVTSTPRREPANANASVTVLKAQLCSGLEKRGSPDWQCVPASGDLPPGTYMFYTRLLTTSETRVEHRWYRDGRVHQTMRLRVSASPGSGYRTFSATTVSTERAGEWKVELRAADGTLLDQASFRVR